MFIAGTGNVGKNLLDLIYSGDMPFTVAGIENRRGQITGKHLEKTDVLNFLNSPSEHPEKKSFDELDFDIYVDLRTASKDGKMELETYRKAFEKGADVVSANKSGLANHWQEIMAKKNETGKRMLFEATVAGGLPIFSLLNSSLQGFQCNYFQGIVNLTANYVMQMITEGISFDEACKMAIKEGIGETDMSDDLTGLDSARKAIIISNAIFGQNLRLKDLKYEGIRNSPDKNMRLLVTAGIDEKFTVTSRIESLETGDSFLRLDPMAMSMRMGFVGRSTVTVSEDTDGPVETAGAVLNDIITLA